MTNYKILLDSDTFIYKNIEISRKNNLLDIANGFCSRTLDLSDGYPTTVSLNNSSGHEFVEKSGHADFSFIGINMPNSKNSTEYEITEIAVNLNPASMFDAEHVRVKITIIEKIQQVTFTRSYLIYPEMPIIAVENSIYSQVTSNIYWSYRGGLNAHHNYPIEFMESSVDTVKFNSSVVPLKTIEFQGRTDYTNELVIEHPAAIGGMNGNLLFCEAGEAGIFVLQEAPPSTERRDFEEYDFRLDEHNTLFSCGWGIPPAELSVEREFTSYRHVIGFFPQGQGACILKNYLKQRFPQNPAKDYSVTVNPWGIGGFPKLVNEQFLMDEIAASADIGATHYQIDDGWQTGRNLFEMIQNNRYITPEFWTVSAPHLPHGFKPLNNVAKKNGIELALWFAPSCNNEYRDWQIQADILFGFYRKYAIRMFKIDAVKIRTKLAEDNLEKLVKNLRQRSAGEIIFNFDTTNGQRPGYFMFLEYGNIFLENRYVYGVGLGYHPEATLNNLWTLSRYTRTQTLQIEIPSHEDVNHEFYAQSNRIQPDLYSAEYWAAIALFANPLLWLAPSVISKELTAVYRKMINLHLQYRDRIFAGEIFPIGQEPNGAAITGLVSHNENDNSGFVLLFREYSAPAKGELSIPQFTGKKYRFATIYESAKTVIADSGAGKLKISLGAPGSFCLLEYR